MNYRVVISPEIAAEALSISTYLEGVREGLGEEFEAELQRVLESISRLPLMYAEEFGPVRKAPIRRFKKALFYTVDGSIIKVQELRDARQKPVNWRKRGFFDN